MTPRTAERLVRLYPRIWRCRYGKECAALFEEHPFSVPILINILCSAAKAHTESGLSQQRNQSIAAGWTWCAWMIAILGGLILYGMVDDSPLAAAMSQSVLFAASWNLVQMGCLLAATSITAAGFPLVCSVVLAAVRERQRDVSLRLAMPFLALFVLIAWIAFVLILTGGHWAASPWAVTFSRPDWPSAPTRWITGAISAAVLVTVCIASAAGVSRIMRVAQFPELKVSFARFKIQCKPLPFAAALAPWAATGMLLMLSGVLLWGFVANRPALQAANGPLGLSGQASWILSTVLLGFAAAMSTHASWRSRKLPPGDSSL